MRVVYVAGPYRSETEAGVFDNILKARKAAMSVWELGAVAVCPHLNTMLMGGLVPDRVFLDGALEVMRRCDLILVLPESKSSIGTQAEIEEAVRLSKPVCYSYSRLREVLRELNDNS